MARKEKEFDQEPQGNEVKEPISVDSSNEVMPLDPLNFGAVEEAAPSEPQKIKAMNVSSTLLHLEDGSPFPPRAIAELTQAEFERFDNFKLIAPK
jgi:hypothetical protein